MGTEGGAATDWDSVDWSLSNAEISRRLGQSPGWLRAKRRELRRPRSSGGGYNRLCIHTDPQDQQDPEVATRLRLPEALPILRKLARAAGVALPRWIPLRRLVIRETLHLYVKK